MKIKALSYFLLLCVAFQTTIFASPLANKEQVLRDSTIKHGKSLESYLKKVTPGGKIIAGRNYSTDINKFLRKNKYVKFPPYALTIGLDSTSAEPTKHHLIVSTGNRLYFPKGSRLKCPPNMKTNGNMIYIATTVRDVFIDGANIIGSKANPNYVTSPYGVGIALYAPSDVIITNVTITKSSGDGIDIRTNWGKQSEDIVVNKMRIVDATRVGMLITGVINGSFKNIYIEGTGETNKANVQKPQTGLSFEPNDCQSKYVNCRFTNLETKNNMGPVLATANFVNLFANNTCGTNKLDIRIDTWTDTVTDPNCYGASLDVSTGELETFKHKFKTSDISGTFVINNPTFVRNTKKESTDYYFIQGKDEELDGGIKYKVNNLKLVHQGVPYNSSNKQKNSRINSLITSNKKLTID